MSTTIKAAAKLGAVIGASISLVLVILTFVMPFPWQINGAIERLTFALCPLLRLGFASGMGNTVIVALIAIIGNAILCGALFTAVAAVVAVYKRNRSNAQPGG